MTTYVINQLLGYIMKFQHAFGEMAIWGDGNLGRWVPHFSKLK